MTNVIPLRPLQLKGDYEPRKPDRRHRSDGPGPLKGHPLSQEEREVLRQTHQHLADCWVLRAESRRIQRGYEERQARIELLLAGLERA